MSRKLWLVDRLGTEDTHDLHVDPNGGIALTINASGLRDGKSRYRYRINFTADEAGRLVGAITSIETGLTSQFPVE